MGKKCVQHVGKAWTNLWKSLLYTQVRLPRFCIVGKYDSCTLSVHSIVHTLKQHVLQIDRKHLYTVSTIPTITTICLKNKRHISTYLTQRSFS